MYNNAYINSNNNKLDRARPPGVQLRTMSSDRLTIFDTTLRDGEQAPGFSMRTDEKLKLAAQLATLGVDIIEAGFPIASTRTPRPCGTIATRVRGP
jgi:2-isopropylmalate synthase